MQVVLYFCLLSGALALPSRTANHEGYHGSVGIKEASRIKALEETRRSDGTRIVGGSPAALGAYPFVGGLVITLVSGFTSVCGSSLLTNTRLVTAAQCWWDGFDHGEQLVVVLGSSTLFTGGTRVITRDVRMHEEWEPWTYRHDIAIITVPWVGYTSAIRNIALPSGFLLNMDFAGWFAQALGFGMQGPGLSISPNQTLHRATLQVLTQTVCMQSYGPALVTGDTVCTAGEFGRNTCAGDTGGPVLVDTGGAVLIGVVSFGSLAGCQGGAPAVHTRITSYVSWLQARL